jgi:hypothetical protein
MGNIEPQKNGRAALLRSAPNTSIRQIAFAAGVSSPLRRELHVWSDNHDNEGAFTVWTCLDRPRLREYKA